MTIDEIIQQIAKEHHTTPEIVRREMEFSMKEAQKTTNPRAKALWASIPHKGDDITLEEFISYIATLAKIIS